MGQKLRSQALFNLILLIALQSGNCFPTERTPDNPVIWNLHSHHFNSLESPPRALDTCGWGHFSLLAPKAILQHGANPVLNKRSEQLSSGLAGVQGFRTSTTLCRKKKKKKSSNWLPHECRIYLFGGNQGAAPISVSVFSREILQHHWTLARKRIPDRCRHAVTNQSPLGLDTYVNFTHIYLYMKAWILSPSICKPQAHVTEEATTFQILFEITPFSPVAARPCTSLSPISVLRLSGHRPCPSHSWVWTEYEFPFLSGSSPDSWPFIRLIE